MSKKSPVNLSGLDRVFFEALDPAALVDLTCRLHALAIEQAERLAQNSTNSSRPPSSDGPFGPPGGAAGLVSGSRTQPGSPQVAPSSLPATPSGRKPGKQRGAKGVWRSAPLEADGTRNHYPAACAICGTVFELWDPNRGHSAHVVLDLEPVGGGIRIACLRHVHHATQCACGAVNRRPARQGRAVHLAGALARPAAERGVSGRLGAGHVHRRSVGALPHLVGPDPRVSGRMVRGALSVGTLDRCIREVGVACEPVVQDLLDDLRQAGVIQADETLWRQKEKRCWLWVVLSSTTAVFHIGTRQGEEIRDLIGDAFLDWLVSDGYGAHRSYKKRQRCFVHLIRKGVALAGGLNPQGAQFGAWLLREVRALIHAVAEGTGARIVNLRVARKSRSPSPPYSALPSMSAVPAPSLARLK